MGSQVLRSAMPIIFLFVLLATWPVAAQDQPPQLNFGIVEGYWRPQATADLGVGWDRITFDWSRFQPDGPGDFNTDAVRDEWLMVNIGNQRDVVGMIVNTPAWASASGLPTAVPDGLYEPFDSPENTWAIFLQQLAATYAPRGVHQWVIWNKPDLQPGEPGHTFDGDVRDYYRLVKVAYTTIKAVDEDAAIFLGGLVWWADAAAGREPYLERFLAVATDDPSAPDQDYYFDGVSLSLIIGADSGVRNTSDHIIEFTRTTRRLLDEAGLADKRLWITELNATPTLDPVDGLPAAPIGISLEQQVDFLLQTTAWGVASGVERIAVYKLFDSNYVAGQTQPFGLLRSDNSPRPAYDAYARIVRLFGPTLRATTGSSTNARLAVLEQADHTLFVMWSAGDQPVSFWVEAGVREALQLIDATGTELAPPRYGVGIGGATVYVIDTPPAIADRTGEILISGSPLILVIESTQPRAVWASTGDGFGVKLY